MVGLVRVIVRAESSVCGRGAVAQLGERLICIQEVAGSIPTSSTILWSALRKRSRATRYVKGSGARQAKLRAQSAVMGALEPRLRSRALRQIGAGL